MCRPAAFSWSGHPRVKGSGVTDFYLTSGETTLLLPLNPQEVRVGSGARMQAFSVLDQGEFAFPRGNTPARVVFEGFFPGVTRQADPWFKEWRPPLEYVAVLGQWKANGSVVTLLVTESRVTGWDLYIERFDTTERGGHGDISFELELVEARQLRILTDAEEAEAAAQAEAAAFSLAAEPPRPATHLVTEEDAAFGDGWLGAIAKRHYGAWEEWATIYEANIDAIQAEVGPDSNIPAVGLELVLP